MPLSEISGNVQRNSSDGQGKPLEHGPGTTTAPAPASAIQSMLKTTTELGDLGQLSSRPQRRMPRSGSRFQSTRPRSGSFDTSFASALRHERPPHIRRPGRYHGPRHPTSSSGLSARNISRSNLSSYTNNSRRRRFPDGPHPYPMQGLASPASISGDLHSQRSLVTLRSQRDMRSMHSKSPVGYRGLLSRNPYRASSLASSDWRSLTHSPRAGFRRAPSTATMASSPASMFPRRRGLPGYRQDMNHSYASLARLPSPALSSVRHSPLSPYDPSLHPPTPLSAVQNPLGKVTVNAVSAVGMSRSPTASTTPNYYDYSESFVEENCFSPDGQPDDSLPPFTMDQLVLKDVPTPPLRHAQTPFGMRQGSSFAPAELATGHNRRPSEHSVRSRQSNQSKHSKKTKLSNPSKPNFDRAVPQRISSLGASALQKQNTDLAALRRAPSEVYDRRGGEGRMLDRCASVASRRTADSSSTSAFFSNAARSSRDLATLAARVHSPPPEGTSRHRLRVSRTSGSISKVSRRKEMPLTEPNIRHSGTWQLPTLSFRPISFGSHASSPALRPRTSEAVAHRQSPEIVCPVPSRPMSSQSRKRFSRILEIEDTFDSNTVKSLGKPAVPVKVAALGQVREAPELSAAIPATMWHDAVSGSPVSPIRSPVYRHDGNEDRHIRISEVTNHDKSTIESLLDKHIDCLGLTPEAERSSTSGLEHINDESTGQFDDSEQTEKKTVKLRDLLAAVPSWDRGRPFTSSSQRQSSLGSTEKGRMRPRRLFASMDANRPSTISEQMSTSISPDQIPRSRPSFGWQTLSSSSQLREPTTSMPSFTSGELADVDSSGTRTKFKVNRESTCSLSRGPSLLTHLSEKSTDMLDNITPTVTPKRTKSEVLERQASHRRRRVRIMLKLKTKSESLGDTDEIAGEDAEAATALGPPRSRPTSPQSIIKSPVQGYAELSAESVVPFETRLSLSPPIPSRWSSIIAAMPEPVKKSAADLIRKASARTMRSHRSNESIVDPVNSTRLNKQVPRLGSVPRLAPPEFGPPLTTSDLDLSLRYADHPSNVLPKLRETRSFFSDNSSAQRQRRSLRDKLHIHSLRQVMPGSSGGSSLAYSTPRQVGTRKVKLDHTCRARGRYSDVSSSAMQDLVPMSDFAYRRRKVLERLKDWWRRQCVPKALTIKRRGERIAPGRAQ